MDLHAGFSAWGRKHNLVQSCERIWKPLFMSSIHVEVTVVNVAPYLLRHFSACTDIKSDEALLLFLTEANIKSLLEHCWIIQPDTVRMVTLLCVQWTIIYHLNTKLLCSIKRGIVVSCCAGSAKTVTRKRSCVVSYGDVCSSWAETKIRDTFRLLNSFREHVWVFTAPPAPRWFWAAFQNNDKAWWKFLK